MFRFPRVGYWVATSVILFLLCYMIITEINYGAAVRRLSTLVAKESEVKNILTQIVDADDPNWVIKSEVSNSSGGGQTNHGVRSLPPEKPLSSLPEHIGLDPTSLDRPQPTNHAHDDVIAQRSRKVSGPEEEFVIDSLRLTLLKELSSKTFTQLMEASLNAQPISDTPRPPKSEVIIATTWRSGSTFLEELLGSHAGMFDQYEPLLPFKMRNFYLESEPDAQNAQKVISDVLHCRYSDDYIKRMKSSSKEMFSRNRKLWKVCSSDSTLQSLCFQRNFLETACTLFPWKLVKTVRIGVQMLKPVMEDKNLNAHIVYLVRDPRAVINSRKLSVNWCKSETCLDPGILCSHMEMDVKAVQELSKQYPDRVHMVRYEDLSLHPEETTKKLLEELHLDYDPLMEQFIKSHTTKNLDKPWSTTRNSASRVTYWTTKIAQNTLDEVQKSCSKIMNTLGYLEVPSAKGVAVKDILKEDNLGL